MVTKAFWQQKTLYDMTQTEWESLCDGCGKCCLHKVIEARDDVADDVPMRADDTMHYVNVACQLLDTESGRCRHYATRLEYVPSCVVLTPERLENIHFMPTSCAYRRLHEGKPLPSWHPLLHDGSRVAMVEAGMATTGYRLHSETDDVTEDDIIIIKWPLFTAP